MRLFCVRRGKIPHARRGPGADRARQVLPAGGVLAVGFAAPQRSDPERSRQREARGPWMAGARGARAAGRPEPRGRGHGPVAARPVFLSPRPRSALLPAPSPWHLSPHLSLASRPGVPASRVPSPDLRLLSEASRSAPCSAAVTAPGHQAGGGGLLMALFECRRPVMSTSFPRGRTVPAMGHGRRSSLSRSREQISAHETRIYERSVAECLSRCSGVVRAPKASGSKSLPEAPEGHSGWSQADRGVSRAGCSASAASPRGPPSLPPGFARKPPHPPGRP